MILKAVRPRMNAAMEAKSSRYETAKLEAQERERRMALLLISPQGSKATNKKDFYFFCLNLKRMEVPRSIAKCISEAQ